MNYLCWYWSIFNFFVVNEIKLMLIELMEIGIYCLYIEGNGVLCFILMVCKVILVIGI